MEQLQLYEKTKKKEQMNAASFGLVAYACREYYKDTYEENMLLDMPVTVREFLEALELFFTSKLQNSTAKVRNILVGHEHGADHGKAHFQCVVDLTVKGRLIKEAGEILIGDVTILIMYQPAKDLKKLILYCQKDNRFEWLREESIDLVFRKNGKGEDTTKVDAFATVYQNRDTMTTSDAKNFIMSYDARTAFTCHRNIELAVQSIIALERVKFEWIWPSHMVKEEYPLIYKWFCTYCIEQPERRKALLLYSSKRGTGKTKFAKSLVSDDGYYVCFRNSFTILPPGKDPRLLLLDDMSYTGGGDKKEMWKALVAGEPTSIRDAYCNYEWSFRVPCIITTNNESLVTYLASSDEFKTQIMFYEVKDYLGPAGTKPVDMDKVEIDVSSDLLGRIKAVESSKVESKGVKSIDLKGFVERAQLVQHIAELQDQIKKLTKKRKLG